MKMIKNIIEYLIAIAVIPAIVLTVISVTELKDVRSVQYELLSEEEGIYNITPGTYEKLRENRKIKNYELESKYPLITQEEIDRATWYINDDLKNEIYIDENGQKRIKVNVGQTIFDGDEAWHIENYEGRIYFYIGNEYFPNRVEIFNETNLKAIINNNVLPKPSKDSPLPLFWTSTGLGFFEIYIENINNLEQFKQYLSHNPLTVTYELADKQDRLVEVYDFSKFRLTYDKNRIRVVFDVDDEYYLWEITKDDKMIPINGQYDLGNVWTVKFYVYEIQQPLIRSLVLLIPLIVVSGVLVYMYNLIKKKGISY